MLALNFASRKFAYRRLVQDISWSLSAFSSFFREYLYPVIKADQCAQYVDVVGIAAINPQRLLRNLKAVFACIETANNKNSNGKVPLRSTATWLALLHHHSTKNCLQKLKISKFLSGKKSSSHDPRKPYNDTSDFSTATEPTYPNWLKDSPLFSIVNNNWRQRQNYYYTAIHEWIPKPEQYIGAVLPICPSTTTSKQTTGANDRRWLPSNRICSCHRGWSQPQIHINEKNFCTSRIRKKNLYSVPEQNVNLRQRGFSYLPGTKWTWTHLLGRYQTNHHHDSQQISHKVFPNQNDTATTLESSDFVLQFNFVIVQIPGKMITAADFLSRLEAGPNEKIVLNIWKDITVKPIQGNIESTGITPEEQIVTTDGSITWNSSQNYSMFPNGTWEQRMPCKKTYFQNNHQLEVTRTLSQQWTYFQNTLLNTQFLPHCNKNSNFRHRHLDNTRVSTNSIAYR